jgi:hypothetical protein
MEKDTLYDLCKELFNKMSIEFSSFDNLDGTKIERDIFLNNNSYNNYIELIQNIKKHLSSSTLTSLQKNASLKQKWPLLNLVRQILKIHNYKMTPIRKANGYSKTGKKLFLRYFIIEKI